MDPTQLLIQAAIESLPTIVSGIKDLFTTKNPTLPPPTDADVIAALNTAYTQSLAKDDDILSKG